jgi:hypothetical protein
MYKNVWAALAHGNGFGLLSFWSASRAASISSGIASFDSEHNISDHPAGGDVEDSEKRHGDCSRAPIVRALSMDVLMSVLRGLVKT